MPAESGQGLKKFAVAVRLDEDVRVRGLPVRADSLCDGDWTFDRKNSYAKPGSRAVHERVSKADCVTLRYPGSSGSSADSHLIIVRPQGSAISLSRGTRHEYTGTAWVAFFGQTESIADAQELFDAVAETDADENGVTWIAPAPLNSTYGVGVTAAFAEEHQLATISDLAALMSASLEYASFCGDAEFLSRDDGYVGMSSAYGFEIPDASVVNVEGGFLYAAFAESDDCVAGNVFSVLAGQIPALGIVVLGDDLDFFPVYTAAVTTTSEYAAEIEELVQPAAELLTDEVVVALNFRVDIEGLEPAEVAREWLSEQGLLP